MNDIVERCELAPGFSISRVLTGLWQIADMERDGRSLDLEATAEAMEPFAAAGFTTFDMADHYGSAEEIAGLFLKRHGTKVQLCTKWVPKPGPITREDVRVNVQRALDRMQTGRLDLLQFHTWDYADPSWVDCLFWLQELKQEGLIRHLGLTNVDTAHLRIALHSGIEVVSNQVCFSMLDQRAAHGMTELCLQHGIKLLAFGTVAGGFLAEGWLGKPEPDSNRLSTWSQMKYKRFIDSAGGWGVFQDLLHTLDNAAGRHGVSIANIACRYILEEPAVGGIIIGARPGITEHIRDNLRLFRFSLDEKNRCEIGAALAKLQPIPGDCGDEYRRPPFLTASGDLSHHVETFPPPYLAQQGADGRSRVLSGMPRDKAAGFSRALRRGKRIWVSGTTAVHGSRVFGGQDPVAQFDFVIDKIEGALKSLGGGLQDVVCSRVYLRSKNDWQVLSRVFEKRFSEILPANTVVQAAPVVDECLVEMEVEAVAGNAI